jgi:dTMP kinase
MFFSFDGIDGVGKTTQMDLFCQWLGEQGHDVVTCRDPGSTSVGERVRDILLNSGDDTPIAACTEMLLYMSARAQLVEEVIQPALASGKTIVSDRFLLANVVYQGHAGGLDVEAVRAVGQVATHGVSPDATFLLDMSPEAALDRMGDDLDRMESRGNEYRRKLRAGFLKEAQQMGDSIHVVDAARPVEIIQADLREIAAQVLSQA